MKIKTFVATTPEEIDNLVNEFEKTHQVKATQTDMIEYADALIHKAVVFYTE